MRIALVCFFSNAIVLVLLLLVAIATAGKTAHKKRDPDVDNMEESTALTVNDDDDDGKGPWSRLEAQYHLFVKLLDIAIPVMAMVFGVCFFIEMNVLIDAKDHGSMADVA
ncbi:hypothetical protein Pmar_PMAR004728 [Perkinsus marinus ATCC 50983]|uniref:Uncharacterized protein n=1 Tax=Perkinsus marinus (strain ATCC 50983 / TXsc) TaxID=423536 RepID=C5KF74_PERM5|nr:hypothetical protein Pmar_PMAR004728 [Perkinsus marinus ATCC 50983]EER16876.1 hypothetical protein Pmar_PMAR004728 [Perkinsus marinus ATCC 50983]|eukprot:XP_002785080.1 hypothetical protein Pmar_PMAR004728 [Perkinsus marinus ATCC 50983]